MLNSFESAPFQSSEKAKATVDGLRETLATQTDAEKRERMITGIDLMASELVRNPDMFVPKLGRTALESVLHADSISASIDQIHREQGIVYDTPGMLESRRSRMVPTDEEKLAMKIAAEDAYYASLPHPEPTGLKNRS